MTTTLSGVTKQKAHEQSAEQRWKPALNAFAITFADRFRAAGTYC